jgi:hypothetical protein
MERNEMKKGFVGLLAVAVLICSWPAARVEADEIGELKDQLSELKNRITELEVRQQQKEKSPAGKPDEVAKQKTEQVALPESLKWLEKIKISGDLRYRHDHLDTQDSGGGWENGVDRDRLRARLMVEAIVNDQWDVAFRIASGSDRSPISTNQDLEDGFSKKDIWLDLAYFDWHPAAADGLNVLGGKIQNPFYRVGRNEMIWDTDLNPEGIAGQFSKPLNDSDRLFVNGGGFWVDENAAGADSSLWGAQTYIKRDLGDSDYLLGGASYWDYGNLQGRSDLKSTWGSSDFFGNTSSGGLYVSDYDIFEGFGEYGFKCTQMPIAVFGSWVQNLVASTSKDTGWLLGAKFNKAAEPGSWEFGYDYRELEADAVVGGFTESEFIDGATDSRGHKFCFTHQWAKNLQAKLAYYHLENTSGSPRDLDYRRLVADLILKF